MKLKGSCLCGGVRFEYDGRIINFGYDHCSRCRKSTGSAFSAWLIVERAGFRWLAGESLVRKYSAPIRESPPPYNRVFCATCGGLVPELMGDQVGIPAGTLDGEQNLRPQGHIFVDFKAPWYEIADNLPQFATKPSR